MADNVSRIQVVDDESIVTLQTEEYLKSMGYEIAGTAHNGEEAIEVARRTRPDLILMDIVMPEDKMDGITASEIIKKELDIPVVFITAFVNEDILKKAKNVEPYGFIVKPFQQNDLKVTIEVALTRKKMEDQLRESEERYRSVVNSATEAIISLNINGDIISWNRSAEKIFGYSVEEVLNKPFIILISDKSANNIQNEIHRYILSGKSKLISQTVEYPGIRKNLDEFPMEFTITTWETRTGVFFTIIARDITERKKIEQMKSDFISLVSHQLKTPVAEIKEFTDIILSGLAGELSDKQKLYLQEMHSISTNNYRLISDLLNVSRIERGVISIEKHPVYLKEIIDLMDKKYQKIIKEKNLILDICEVKTNLQILADKQKFIEALSNVIDNAIKFTDKGKITIKTDKDNNNGIVEIIDTGAGIPDDMLNKLFKKDQILSGGPRIKGGCGLGLYIAKKFMTLQQGDISAHSTYGRGSRFVFKIPLFENSSDSRRKE
jgi:PAS domain S-box-containing protein